MIWSRLPDLNIRQGPKTRDSIRGYMLQTSQLSIWTGFEQEVRQETASVFGHPNNFVQPALATEHHVVATESGVSARMAENISQAMGTVFEAQGLRLRFGDSPAGSSTAFGAIPDVMIESLQNPGRPLVVGEFKTPWTKYLDTMADDVLANLIGIPILRTVIPRYRC
jgi:hypothetical protein